MKRVLLLCLFLVGISFALFNFKGLANRGNFDSIVVDFREDIPATEIAARINAISGQFDITPQLNSAFSVSDRIYTQPPYASKGKRDQTNEQDGTFQRGGHKLMLAVTETQQGVAATFDIGLQIG